MTTKSKVKKVQSEIVRVPQHVKELKQEQVSLLSALAAAAGDPSVSVDKMERMWSIHKEMTAAKALMDFNNAKNKLQPLLPVIKKNGAIEFVDKNLNSRSTPYALREDIEKAIRPLYTEAGFSTEYDFETRPDGKIVTVLILRHTGGHVKEYRTPPMALDTSGSKNNNQGAGSTMEYGKRYAITGAFNVITEGLDDDGNNGKEPGHKEPDRFAQDKEVVEESNSSLLDAAESLRAKLFQETDKERKGAILMANVKLLEKLEAIDPEHAAFLREMAEG